MSEPEAALTNDAVSSAALPATPSEVPQPRVGVGGDVHPLEARAKASWLTPVPGGVGPLTIAQLLRNTLLAAGRHDSIV